MAVMHSLPLSFSGMDYAQCDDMAQWRIPGGPLNPGKNF